MNENMALMARDVQAAYGPVQALRGCSLALGKGEVVAVVGANGAGKTTLLRVLSGLIRPSAGILRFGDTDIRRCSTHQLARDGLLHVPEGRGTLLALSVLENLRIAYDIRPSARRFEEALDRVFQLFPRLAERRALDAGNMSGGEQQMLALARVFINPPVVLLLDEPSLGLSPVMVKEAYRALETFKELKMTILVVEQNLRVALRFAQRAYVLRHGLIVHAGPSADLLSDPRMMDHYMGTH